MDQAQRRQFLLRGLLAERPEYRALPIPESAEAQRRLLRSLMNVRPAAPLAPALLSVQDEYLREAAADRGITPLSQLEPVQPELYLWQGDITTLQCDAIVNAANSGLTGCYIPCHACIDNCIHTFAGVQLRQACQALMDAQGHPEPTGRARITPAFNLPCRYVLHTVGPIIRGRVTARDEQLLASCYRSCLELAEEKGLESVAFCWISTGVFHFPNQRAAQIAVRTVRQYKAEAGSKMKVIFNVFQDADRTIYARLLGPDRPAAGRAD